MSTKNSTATYLTHIDRPLVIAHRGSSGINPEHTLGAMSGAYYSGADFIKVDIQMT